MTHLPSLSVVLVDYDSNFEVGRYALCNSGVKCSHDGKTISYVIDPSAADPQSQIRDIKAMKPAWYISVQPMKTPTTPAKK